MADEGSDAMDLDLNLGSLISPSSGLDPGSGSDFFRMNNWVEEERIPRRHSESVTLRPRQRWRRQVQIHPETVSMSVEFIGNSGDVNESRVGEGSGPVEGRTDDNPPKMCENNSLELAAEAVEEHKEQENGCSDHVAFFDCNICLELANDPVVTCCGHLFCWPCLYHWLHVYSDAKECPVCKGEVNFKNVIPIYGRGSSTEEPESDSGLKVPFRPQARRVESLRQSFHRNSLNITMEEMFRRIGSRFDLARDMMQAQEPTNVRDVTDRTNSLHSRYMTPRGMRREQNMILSSDDAVNLPNDHTTSLDVGGEHRRVSSSSLLLRRSHSHRLAAISSFSSVLNSSERVVDTYFQSHLLGRNHDQSQPIEDRDSFSSIGAVIHSESQTIDTAVDIDSTVSLSTSSSRRRNETSRVSDVDSGDSRPTRRRRLN